MVETCLEQRQGDKEYLLDRGTIKSWHYLLRGIKPHPIPPLLYIATWFLLPLPLLALALGLIQMCFPGYSNVEPPTLLGGSSSGAARKEEEVLG